jgi:phosphoribosylformylglycinamidine synthase PurS subunit
MPTARITIRLKPAVLDAQGAVLKSALHSLGFDQVQEVHVGKFLELELAPGATPAEARAAAEEMCRKLLANPVIEQYAVAVEPDGVAAEEGS